MKQLNRIQSAIFLIGGLLMVAGVACCVLMVIPTIMCWVYLLGAVMFATMQVSQLYEGNELVVRRLKKLFLQAYCLQTLSMPAQATVSSNQCSAIKKHTSPICIING